MQCPTMVAASLLPALSVVAAPEPPDGGLVAGLNFANVTAQRVVEPRQEIGPNWKVVDAGDFDNDGDLDVVVGNAWLVEQRPNKLYRNDGGVFIEVGGPPIIAGFAIGLDMDITRGVAFRDVDGDGWLDIVVVNDGGNNCAPPNLCGPSRIYMNRQVNGRFSHFEDEGPDRLPGKVPGLIPGARAAVFLDADHDGDCDFFVAVNGQDRLFFNNALGFFEEVTETNLPVESFSPIDATAADVNDDGKTDLLITNAPGEPTLVYYNDNGGVGLATGDFSDLWGSVDPPGDDNESTLLVVDFNGDGGRDLYGGNRIGVQDFTYLNLGNDAQNMAVFAAQPVTQQVSLQVSCKPTVADLNGDDRPDMIVTAASGHPRILRNTSVHGVISFVDWTPYPAFALADNLSAWNVAVFDTNGDGDQDIFIGGYDHDHLLEQVPPDVVDEQDLADGRLTGRFNADPLAIVGRTSADETDLYTLEDIGPDSLVSVVLNGPDDYLLEVLDSGGVAVLAVSNRGGLGVEEALQVQITSAGTYYLRVAVLDCAVEAQDLDGNCAVDAVDFQLLLSAWGTNPGHPADFDGDGLVGIVDLLTLLASWQAPDDYVLEVLSRS